MESSNSVLYTRKIYGPFSDASSNHTFLKHHYNYSYEICIMPDYFVGPYPAGKAAQGHIPVPRVLAGGKNALSPKLGREVPSIGSCWLS